MDSDKLTNMRVHAIAKQHRTTVTAVHQALDKHPIEVDRDRFLKRTLALELVELDELQQAFRDKAINDRDVASALLITKILERREVLLGLSAPAGHAVTIIQHPPETRVTSTDRIAACIARIRGKPLPPPGASLRAAERSPRPSFGIMKSCP